MKHLVLSSMCDRCFQDVRGSVINYFDFYFVVISNHKFWKNKRSPSCLWHEQFIPINRVINFLNLSTPTSVARGWPRTSKCAVNQLLAHSNSSRASETETLSINKAVGRVMAQAVSRRPLTAEVRFRSRVSPCGFYGDQIGTGTGFFFRSTSVFPCKFNSTGASLHGITKKTNQLHYMVEQ